MDQGRRTFFLKPGVLEAPEKPGRLARARAALDEGVRLVAGHRAQLGDKAEASLAVLQVRLDAALAGGRSQAGKAADDLAQWFNAALGTVEFGGLLNDWLCATFASSRANAYDRAMDAVYNATHLGGGNHRIFDGGHSCLGAWDACSQAAEAQGDGFTALVGGYLGAMWKDVVTPKGLPVATWERETFQSVQDALVEIGLSRDWLSGMVCVNAADLMGAATGVLSVALGWSRADMDKFSELAGNFGISAGTSLNPLLALVALVCLARAFQLAKGRDVKGRILISGAKGGLGSAVFVGAMALFSAKVWIGLMVGVIASILARKAFEAGERQLAAVEWSEIGAFITGYLTRALPGRQEALPA